MLTEQQVINVINNMGLDVNLDAENTSTDESFRSLGIDSLDVFNLLIEVETLTGRNVPDGDVEQLTSIKKIVKYYS